MEAMGPAIDCHISRLALEERLQGINASRRVQQATTSKHLDDQGIEEQ